MLSIKSIAAGALAAMFLYGPATFAKVSPEEAAKLKTELTPLGGIRAGNADGSIPAWDGGYTKVPAGYKSGEPRMDPFANEKPLFTITAANMAQYADKLTEGQKALLKKHKDYYIAVYPTHRTAAAPQWVYDNTAKNAVNCEASDGGYSIRNCYGGLPFPIPKSGAEVLWNHLIRWRGEATDSVFRDYITTGSGSITLASENRNRFNFPMYFKGGSSQSFSADWNGNFQQAYSVTKAPPIKAGFAFILLDNVDVKTGRQAWQYLTGQRRVRRAPTFAYDTPNPVTSAVDFIDEPFVLLGHFDKYSVKLIGKKEIYIPYNNNGAFLVKDKDLVGPYFWNPKHVRHELHRVWVVEATLREGQRHVVPKKVFYLDEDTGNGAWMDGYDANGQLWHINVGAQTVMFEYPGTFLENFQTIDIIKNSYSSVIWNETRPQWKMMPPWPAKAMTPENMAAEALE